MEIQKSNVLQLLKLMHSECALKPNKVPLTNAAGSLFFCCAEGDMLPFITEIERFNVIVYRTMKLHLAVQCNKNGK